MAGLIFIANVSLDGFTEDEGGDFQWSEPSDEVFSFITDLIRPDSPARLLTDPSPSGG